MNARPACPVSDAPAEGGPPAPAAATSLSAVVGTLLRHPVSHVWRRWNYKAAITSSCVRGALFFLTNLSAGVDAASAALLTEWVLRFATSGFYGAVTQALGRVEPVRTGLLAAVVVLPVLAHGTELLAHWARGTSNLWRSVAVSVCFTVLSTSFSHFAMRRGVLAVGHAGSRSLVDDLRAIPATARDFVRTGGGLF